MFLSDVAESLQTINKEISITLSAVAVANLAQALTINYINNKIIIRRALIGSNYAVIADPIAIFDGAITSWSASEDRDTGAATLEYAASSRWMIAGATNGRRSNGDEQNLLYPTDTFFEFARNVAAKELAWGRV